MGWRQGDYGAGKIADMYSDYLRPCNAAKFWLNRYLRLTKQDVLPKQTAVTNLAVIHWRCNPESAVGRLMNDPTLMCILNAIKGAKVCAKQAGEAPFSHIILYGDFVSKGGFRLQDLAAKAFTEDQARVLNISRPWLPRGK